MPDSDVSVRFGADTAGVTSGGAQVKGVLAGIQEGVASLASGFKSMGGVAVGAFNEAKAAATEASTSLKEMRDTGLEVKEAVRGIGEAFLAAFAVEQLAGLAHGLADTAEQTQHTAETFGLTTDEVQRLKAEAAGLGIPFEAFTTAMQRSDRALTTAREGSKQASEAFKLLGIDISKPIDQAKLFQEEIAGLANIQDVPTRIGIAMQLFGRNIQAIAPLIGATKEQIDAVTQATDQYGAVNDGAQQKGLALADAFNLQKIEMQGLGNTVTAELAPELTALVKDITGLIESFRQWASQGDNLKDLVGGLTLAAGALASILGAGALTAAVEGLAALLSGVFLGALQIATGGMVEFDAAADANPVGAVVIAVAALTAGFLALSGALKSAQQETDAQKTAESALRSETGQLNALMSNLAGSTKDELAAAKTAAQNIKEQAAAHLAAAQAALAQAKAEYALDAELGRGAASKRADDKDQIAGLTAAANDATQALAGAQAALTKILSTKPASGGGGDIISKLTGSKGGKPADEVAQAMQAMTDQWQHGADMIAAVTGNANANLAQDEIHFWAAKLKTAKEGSDLWFAILEKLNPLVAQQEQEQTNAAERGAQTRLKLIDEETKAKVKGVQDQLAATVAGLDEEIAAVKDRLASGLISRKQASAEIIADIKKEEAAKLAELDAETQMTDAALAAEVAAAVPFSDQWEELVEQRAQNWQNAENLRVKITGDANKQILGDQTQSDKAVFQEWQSVTKQMVSSFTSGLVQIAEGTKTLQQELRSIGQGILNDFLSKVIDPMITNWLMSEARQTIATITGVAQRTSAQTAGAVAGAAAQKAANQPVILQDAFLAAANVYAQVSSIPVIGPFLAPGAADAAFAAVEAFSASGGFDIGNFAPLTQLHPREMVLPARLANPMRDMLEGGGPSGGNSFGGHSFSFGDTNIQGSTNMGHAEVEKLLSDHRDALMDTINTAYRQNYRHDMGSPFKT